METKSNFNVLSCIERIYESAAKSKLNQEFFDSNKDAIAQLSEFLETEPIETVLFATAFVRFFESNSLKHVFEHLGLKEFHQLRYQAVIEQLYAKALLVQKSKFVKKEGQFHISKSVIHALTKGVKMNHRTITDEAHVHTLVDVMQSFQEFQEQLENEDVAVSEMFSFALELVEQNRKFPLFEKLLTMQLSSFENYFFLKTLCDAINEGDNDFNTHILETVKYVYTLKGAAFSKFQQIVKRETKLTKLDLIEFSKVSFSNVIRARLSDAIVGFLVEKEGIQFEAISRVEKNLIQPNDIAHKELIYEPSEKSQLTLVAQALEVDAFISLQQRLEARALPKGISVLLHGAPGTGKTETVYQLAKKTQRCVFKVDISETKSMWFGESQKLIKRVFDTYEQLMKSEKNTPILLFNEADGLISKRKEVGNSSVADTENAIQNILLEELERFNGIFFATTNFVQNMDDAFERRFLFKVKFEKPDSESLMQIWQHKLPILLPQQAAQLARTFAFSGGEIDNIVRKVLMHELLHGKVASFEQVLEFSRQEKWSKQTVGRMGYNW